MSEVGCIFGVVVGVALNGGDRIAIFVEDY